MNDPYGFRAILPSIEDASKQLDMLHDAILAFQELENNAKRYASGEYKKDTNGYKYHEQRIVDCEVEECHHEGGYYVSDDVWCENHFQKRKAHITRIRSYNNESHKQIIVRAMDEKEWYFVEEEHYDRYSSCRYEDCNYKECGHESYYKGSWYLRGTCKRIYVCDWDWNDSMDEIIEEIDYALKEATNNR
jgi:hypothetical protein